jgi:hypothetical protein
VPDHLCRDRGLVDKDEACCTQLGLLSFQHSALDSAVRPILLSGVPWMKVRSLWDFDADLAAETGERFDAPDSMPIMSRSTLRFITFMSNLLQSLLKFIFRQQHENTRPAGGTIETSLPHGLDQAGRCRSPSHQAIEAREMMTSPLSFDILKYQNTVVRTQESLL